MSEIYWITRLDAVNTVLLLFMVVCTIISIIVGIIYYINNGQRIYEESKGCDYRAKEYKGYADTCVKTLKWSLPIAIISLILFVFTPTTKQGLLIYGVGSTIDYVKSNDTAKQLPDKCIDALDKWMDSLRDDKDKK